MYRPNFKCTYRGVPVLSHEDIERDVDMLFQDYNSATLNVPGPINIDKISEFYLGLTPRFFRLSSYGGILGMMIFNDNPKIPIYVQEERRADYYDAERGEILIDSSLAKNEHRERSTMGHEIGHWIYHQQYYCNDRSSGVAATRRSDIERTGRKKLVTDQDWLEHQANYFSAALLMPRKTMTMLCNDPLTRRDVCRDYPDREFEGLAIWVSFVFNVSVESAKIRIKQLNLDYKDIDPDARHRWAKTDLDRYLEGREPRWSSVLI